MMLSPPEQARSDIMGNGLSKTTIANALALLGRAHPYNGHITITWDSICDLWGLTNPGSAQRYLGRIAHAGIIHYTTNQWIYVTFRAWPPSEISAWSLPNQRVESTEVRVGSTVFDSDENPKERVESTAMRVGSTEVRVESTESARGVYLKSAHIELNERMNDLLLTPKEIDQSFAILTDPEIRMSRAKSEELASRFPFADIRAFCCNFVADGWKPGKDAGLISKWLESSETVPPQLHNDLWQRHRTPAEIAEAEEREAEAKEDNRRYDEAQAQRQAQQVAPVATAPALATTTTTSAEELWQMALDELALSMPAPTFEAWVRDTNVLGYTDGEFVIGVPHAYARDWLSNRLRSQIKRILGRLCQRSVEVTFTVRPRPGQEPPQ